MIGIAACIGSIQLIVFIFVLGGLVISAIGGIIHVSYFLYSYLFKKEKKSTKEININQMKHVK